MDQLSTFIQDRWIVIVVAIVVLFLVIKIVKTVIKWVIVLVIIAGLLYYGANYTDKLKEIGASAVSSAKDEALQALASKNAKFVQNSDGSYTVTSGKAKLDGKPGATEVTLSFAGMKVADIKLDDAVKALIEGAKKNG